MRHKIIDNNPKTYALIFETGEELAKGLKQFAEEQELEAASFKAIGALSSVQLGWFDWDTKQYRTSVLLNEQLELLSLIGDIALKDGKPAVHAHLVVGKKDGTAHGGHLLKATIRPTCEVILTESPEYLKKQIDAESGIALIRP
jgi:predicted DNA-binding protein with PD1-like motif